MHDWVSCLNTHSSHAVLAFSLSPALCLIPAYYPLPVCVCVCACYTLSLSLYCCVAVCIVYCVVSLPVLGPEPLIPLSPPFSLSCPILIVMFLDGILKPTVASSPNQVITPNSRQLHKMVSNDLDSSLANLVGSKFLSLVIMPVNT